LYKRISLSLATFCFVLIGLPLAIFVKPSGKAFGISIAFGLLLAYYGFMQFGIVLSRQDNLLHGITFGNIMIFLPNIVLVLLGAFMMRATIRR
jgi:lipopolysaccharide export LptBFGC system permease protein LptF